MRGLTQQRFLDLAPLAGSLGVRVEGIDLATPLDDDVMADLREVFLTSCVLVFPGQHLSPEQHANFAARWGELHFMPTVRSQLDQNAAVVEVDYRGARPTTDKWHSDMSHEARPPMASLLYAKIVPPAGGDTMFANQYLAYEALSEGLKNMLKGVKAVHTGGFFATVTGLDPDTLPKSTHPVIRTHPETGRKALYVNAFFTTHFEGMSREESEPLLQWLYAHCSQPNFTFRHRWSVGDLVIWDNRCVQHYGVADYGSSQRKMHRVTVLGDRPV